jgi:hypothetical protein
MGMSISRGLRMRNTLRAEVMEAWVRLRADVAGAGPARSMAVYCSVARSLSLPSDVLINWWVAVMRVSAADAGVAAGLLPRVPVEAPEVVVIISACDAPPVLLGVARAAYVIWVDIGIEIIRERGF